MMSASEPSLPSSTQPTAPGSPGSPARSTTAPAPSPNSTPVVRSPGSMMVLNASAPMTRTCSAAPDAIRPAATDSPYRKPVHTAETSKAGRPVSPSRCATSGAVAGHGRSGVVVASSSLVTIRGGSQAPRPQMTADRAPAAFGVGVRMSPSLPDGATTVLDRSSGQAQPEPRGRGREVAGFAVRTRGGRAEQRQDRAAARADVAMAPGQGG